MKARNWINKFKSSLVLKDADKLDTLIGSMPEFNDLKEMEETYFLMEQARELFESLKSEERHKMNKAKASMNYIKSGITFHR